MAGRTRAILGFGQRVGGRVFVRLQTGIYRFDMTISHFFGKMGYRKCRQQGFERPTDWYGIGTRSAFCDRRSPMSSDCVDQFGQRS